jgi:hypothetical protein
MIEVKILKQSYTSDELGLASLIGLIKTMT